MDVALCVPFLEGDAWVGEVRAALPGAEVFEYNSGGTLLPALRQKDFSLLIIALDGPEGGECVKQAKSTVSKLPVLWISDEDLSLQGYDYRVACFLKKPVSHSQLEGALRLCLREKIPVNTAVYR